MFKVVSLGLYTASPADAKLFKAFHEADSFKLSKCILRFCLKHGDIIKTPFTECNLEFWENEGVT